MFIHVNVSCEGPFLIIPTRINNGLIDKVFVGPFILPTSHKHLVLLKIGIISSKMTQIFLTLYLFFPSGPCTLDRHSSQWMQLFPERHHFHLGASWVMIRMKVWELYRSILKIQDSALTIPEHSASLFPSMINPVWPGWYTFLVTVQWKRTQGIQT